MPTETTVPARSATSRGEPRWFFGALAQVKAAAADTNGEYTLVDLLYPPHVAAPLHVHYTEDEGFYVLEGSVTITVGDETVELTAGQHAFGPRNVPHRFVIGPEGARMIWVLTPGGFEDLVEAASVPAEGLTVPPASVRPPADAAEIVRRHGNELLEG
jgi:mannose-6-phosphate isomerase-like protein (cupin superfamily)